jgi:hypothetical protein
MDGYARNEMSLESRMLRFDGRIARRAGGSATSSVGSSVVDAGGAGAGARTDAGVASGSGARSGDKVSGKWFITRLLS